MKILIAGIPTPDLVSYINQRYGRDVTLFVAESRPFERHVAHGVAGAKDAGIRVTLCTDNMIGSLMSEHEIEAVWSQYSRVQGGLFTAVNGARMAAVLAREHGIPFMLFFHSAFPPVDEETFNGQPVSVEGATYIGHELDTVRADMVSEAV